MREFWDRLIHMTSPDGAVVPFGPSSGWNSGAGMRLMALEMAARYTRDGRYRFAAHRLLNYLFCLVRDTATFRERFAARIGPNWYTQNIGPQVGQHWANTYFTAPISFGRKLHNPQVDLLVYHAPHGDRRLIVTDDTSDVRRLKVPYTLRYAWEGTLEPDRAYSFAHLLLPGLPRREPVRSNVPGAASLADVTGRYMAAGVTVLKDDTEQSVWHIRSDEDRQEWVILNPAGKPVRIDGLTTDARQAYVDLREGQPVRVLALDATHLEAGTQEIFSSPTREDYEK